MFRERVPTLDPNIDIIKIRATGTGNMATLTADGPNPRFEPGEAATLTAIIGTASGGTDSATLSLYQKIRSDPTGTFDLLRREFKKFGTSNDAFIDWRIHAAEQRHWVMAAGDAWVPVWTNPDSGNMTWKLEFQFAVRSG
jgi:hypothetical protein